MGCGADWSMCDFTIGWRAGLISFFSAYGEKMKQIYTGRKFDKSLKTFL
jgi:hypothetical protein